MEPGTTYVHLALVPCSCTGVGRSWISASGRKPQRCYSPPGTPRQDIGISYFKSFRVPDLQLYGTDPAPGIQGPVLLLLIRITLWILSSN